MLKYRLALALAVTFAVANAAVSAREFFTVGEWVWQIMPPPTMPGFFAPFGAAVCAIWILLHARGGEAAPFAKAGLALLLVGPVFWWTTYWPSLFQGPDETWDYWVLTDEGQRAIRDIKQAQFVLALSNLSAAICIVGATARLSPLDSGSRFARPE